MTQNFSAGQGKQLSRSQVAHRQSSEAAASQKEELGHVGFVIKQLNSGFYSLTNLTHFLPIPSSNRKVVPKECWISSANHYKYFRTRSQPPILVKNVSSVFSFMFYPNFSFVHSFTCISLRKLDFQEDISIQYAFFPREYCHLMP